MASRLDVGNLGAAVDVAALRSCFERYGRVLDVRVVYGGHAFVTMSTAEEGASAMEGMDGTTFEEQALSVIAAREQPPRAEVSRRATLRLARIVRERCGIAYDIEQGESILRFRMSPTDDGTGEPRWHVELTWSRAPELRVSAAARTRAQAVEDVGRLWRERERPNGLPPVDWRGLLQLLARIQAL